MGFFDKLKAGLTKSRSNVGEGVNTIFSTYDKIDDDFYDELEETLIMADVGIKTTDIILENLKKKVKEQRIKSAHECKKLLMDTIKEQMRVNEADFAFEREKTVLLMIGVNGTGKTTTSGKLAARYKKEGKRVLMAACDTFRAAAVGQLKTWGERTGTAVIAQEQEGADPASVVFDAIHAAQARNTDVLLVDTAGRLHNKKNLMEELAKIRRVIEREAPDAAIKSLLIIDATTGQNAVIQAEGFGEVTGLDYVGITKLDGSAKGGVAIAVAYQSKKPIVLAGLGESVEDLADFDPELFVNSLINE